MQFYIQSPISYFYSFGDKLQRLKIKYGVKKRLHFSVQDAFCLAFVAEQDFDEIVDGALDI